MYQVSIFQKFTDNECCTLKFHNMNLMLFEVISYVLIVVFQRTKDFFDSYFFLDQEKGFLFVHQKNKKIGNEFTSEIILRQT